MDLDTNYKRSIELCKSIGVDPSNTDDLYLHALEVIGAISRILEGDSRYSSIKTMKQRIFWKTIQEIATQQLDEAKDDKGCPVNSRSATKMLLTAFPDNKKNTWLPMHFAVVLPSVDIKNIQVLLKLQPKALTTPVRINLPNGSMDLSVMSYHLAVMAKPPNLAVIDLLKMLNPNFGRLIASNGSTALHFAAEFSNSVALIQKLIQLNPKALEMRNINGDTPLFCVAKNRSIEAPEILKALLHAAPNSVGLQHNGLLPLHHFLSDGGSVGLESILILLEAYSDAVNIPSHGDGWMPIHIAARHCSVDILRVITEANPEQLSVTVPVIGSVAHCAAVSETSTNICYIHSIMPELFHSVNEQHKTPLQIRTEEWSDRVQEIVNLVPETARNVDSNGDNLLHTLITTGNLDNDLIRLFLRLIPGGAIAVNNQGQTPYDLLVPSSKSFILTRRLLLLAGAPSLHPKTRKLMNYQARKGALLAFFAGTWTPNIFYRIRDTGTGIVLMRQVISFL